MKRVAMVIDVKPEKLEEYRELHAAVWPDVLAALRRNGVRNYSIFLKDCTLFGYLEFEGDDYEAAMARVADDEATQRWWKLTEPCQQPWPGRSPNEWWADMEEVFHVD
ncbi:MAG: L-rhamnose mutarotase [Deltaproteobacteria bacterium]|nr:L-rhamnose mutarotase [Deltaproteobacteria bacterium]MBW2414325.1 L-rhamnose mutarotase [Deltaproteobacteria bacterium]